jgi:hypothetical protein
MFDRLVWEQDRILLDDLVFHLGRQKTSAAQGGTDGFVFHKGRRILDQYAAALPRFALAPTRNLLELGIYDGGSIAFWFEHLRPQRYVALDKRPWGDSPYFSRYVESRGLSGQIKTYWETDQGDREALRRIVASEFVGPLDIVLDDASHQYEPTKVSFEALFPLLRSGGLYVIEDWSWGCWPILPDRFPFPKGSELPRLVCEIMEAAGSMSGYLVGSGPLSTLRPLIASVTVTGDLVFVERGPAEVGQAMDFSLDRSITRRP